MYARVIREALQSPWALTPRYLAIVQDILRFRAAGGRLTEEELRARIGPLDDERPRPRTSRAGAVAVIPIYGVILHRHFDAVSGATSTEIVSALHRRALADEEVETIVLDCASPGGTVVGVPELAAQIVNGRKQKHTVAVVNGEACSACYWIASQANEIVSIPSGYTGSIGVYTLVEDWSEHLEKEGIKLELIHAGENKIEGGRWWEPLSEEAREHLQNNVNRIYNQFLAAVAKGRGVAVADVRKNYGAGRVFDAKEALERGMIDRIATMEETIARLTGGSRSRAGGGRARAEAGDPDCTTGQPDATELAAPEPPAPATPPAADDQVDRDLITLTESLG